MDEILQKVEKAESVQMWKQVKFLCKSVTVQPDTHVPEKKNICGNRMF